MAAMRPAYWARIQSSLKRLATNTVTVREVVGDLGGQRLDPGVELLLGQLLRQLVDAGLPQAVAGASGRHGPPGCGVVPRLIVLLSSCG